MLNHSESFQSVRRSLGLQAESNLGFYEPSSALIGLGKGYNDRFTQGILNHEVCHLNQISSTTLGLTILTTLAYRNTMVENRLKSLNRKFSCGLWSPVKGWLDTVYGGTSKEFYDPNFPYFHISAMKQGIGTVDSLLFALGYFDTDNDYDRRYWMDRFPWKSKFADADLQYSFFRNIVPGPMMTSGVKSLLESTVLYLELLEQFKSSDAVNKHINDKFFSGRWQDGAPNPVSRDFIYYGAFTECHFSEKIDPPPYHLLPICSFWALNSPMPHFAFEEPLAIRYDEINSSWMKIAPQTLFEYLIHMCSDNKQFTHVKLSSASDLLALSQKLQSMAERICGRDFLSRSIEQDADYVEKCLSEDICPSLSYKVALTGVKFKDTLGKRLQAYYSFPSSLMDASVQLIHNKQDPATKQNPIALITDNLKVFIISHLGEHLFPTWTADNIDRFTTARYLYCPSISFQLESLCPAYGKCTGKFPGVRGLPSQCWFQEILKDTFNLSANDIGIITGYNSNE